MITVCQGEKDLQKAIELFNSGGIAVFPTDTVFGVGCIPKENNLERLYKIKKRNPQKPTALLVASKKQAEEILEKDENVEKLIEKFWPGGLTIVARNKKNFSRKIAPNGFVGVRWPKYSFLEKIIRKTGPLAVSSANIEGSKEAKRSSDLSDNILSEIDFLISGEPPRKVGASTVVKVDKENLEILREGTLKKREIIKALS